MDMTDNELLEQMFRPMREMQIEDDGFTERVMQQIELQESSAVAGTAAARNSSLFTLHSSLSTKRLAHLWTALCIAIAVVLFIVMRGWITIGQGIYDLLTTPPTVHSLLMLIITVSVPALIALTETVRHERLSPI